MTARLNKRNGNAFWFCNETVDGQRKTAQDPKANSEEYCCNFFLENSLFLPVLFALKMDEELKPVVFNVESYPYQFEPIATESDCEISDDIRPTAMASKVKDRIGKGCWWAFKLIYSWHCKSSPFVKKCVTTSFQAFLLFFAAKQRLCTFVILFDTFLYRPVHNYNVKWPNSKFCIECEHTTVNFMNYNTVLTNSAPR